MVNVLYARLGLATTYFSNDAPSMSKEEWVLSLIKLVQD